MATRADRIASAKQRLLAKLRPVEVKTEGQEQGDVKANDVKANEVEEVKYICKDPLEEFTGMTVELFESFFRESQAPLFEGGRKFQFKGNQAKDFLVIVRPVPSESVQKIIEDVLKEIFKHVEKKDGFTSRVIKKRQDHGEFLERHRKGAATAQELVQAMTLSATSEDPHMKMMLGHVADAMQELKRRRSLSSSKSE